MKQMIGKVNSNKMTGTVSVLVERYVTHPLYRKRLIRSQKFLAVTDQKLNIGDTVEIAEVRPVSKRVHFKVTKVVGKTEVLPSIQGSKEENAAA